MDFTIIVDCPSFIEFYCSWHAYVLPHRAESSGRTIIVNEDQSHTIWLDDAALKLLLPNDHH